MSVLKLKGSTSGYVELSAPATSGDNTITLPTTAGTAVVTDANGDTNIGTGVNLSVPASNEFAISTNGSERVRVSAGGSFGIGTDGPVSKLHISDTDGTTTITGTRGSGHSYKLETTGSNAEGFNIIDVDNSQRAWLYYAGANPATDSYHTFNTNNVEKVRIDASGRVTMPYQPAFSAYKSDNGGQIAAGVYVFNATHLNRGNHYSTSTGRFTAPVSGAYYFIASLQLYGGTYAHCRYQKNGSDIYAGGTTSAVYEDGPNTHAVITFGAVIDMSASDYVEVVRDNTTRGMQSSFSGYLIG